MIRGLALGPGEPLPTAERGYFERRLGTDLSAVRVHPQADTAKDLTANAFTAGRDIGFAPGRYRPGTREGRRLIGHELAHVLEQGARGTAALQLDGPPSPAAPELKLPDKEAGGAAEAVGGGLSTLKDVATEDPVIKAGVIDPLKAYAEAKWNRLPGDEQAAVAVGGIALYGTFLAGMLSSAKGRAVLSDFNLATPLVLVPYGTIDELRFILPPAGSGPVIFGGRLKGDDWLRLALGTPKDQFAPTLGVDFTWRYDPAADRVGLSGGKIDLGLLPGLNLQAGAGVGLRWPTPVTDPSGAPAWSMQRLPGDRAEYGTGGLRRLHQRRSYPTAPGPALAALPAWRCAGEEVGRAMGRRRTPSPLPRPAAERRSEVTWARPAAAATRTAADPVDPGQSAVAMPGGH